MKQRPPAKPQVQRFKLFDKYGELKEFKRLHFQFRLNSHETPSDDPLLELVEYATDKLGWTTRQFVETALTLLYQELSNDKSAPQRFRPAHITSEMLELLRKTEETQSKIMQMLQGGQLVARDGVTRQTLKSMGVDVMKGASNFGGAVEESEAQDADW